MRRTVTGSLPPFPTPSARRLLAAVNGKGVSYFQEYYMGIN